jgi:integrase
MLVHSKAVTEKRGNKMTTYYVRGSIIWLNYYVDGKRLQKSTKLQNTPENIKVVEKQIIPALNVKIATGEIYKKKPKTFEHYGFIFLKQKSPLRSYALRRSYYQRVIDHFGKQNIDTITRLDIKQYLSAMEIKNVSRNIYKSCINEIFELAVDDGVIANNPAANIKLTPEKKEAVEYYTREEVERILNVTDGVMRAYLEIAFNTGMRSGEILGLQLSDFGADGFIRIKRTRTRGTIGQGKNSNALRKIPYSKYLLDRAREIQPKDNIFIFGKIDDAMKLRHQWSTACKKAGVKKIKLYATRHTFATLMLKEKIVSINELATLLGHSSPKITLQHYASLIDVNELSLGSGFSLFRDKSVTISKRNSEEAL